MKKKTNATASLIYYGTVYSKKNSKRIVRNRATGKMMLISSAAAKANEEDMIYQFATQRPLEPLRPPLRIAIGIYQPNNFRRDLDNQQTAVLDALKSAEIIMDDDFKNVSKLSVEFKGVDKNNPRAEVFIEGRQDDTEKEAD